MAARARKTGKKRPVTLVLSLVTVLGGLAPVLLALLLTADSSVHGPRRVRDVLDRFARQGYDLEADGEGRVAAPRDFLPSLPRDWRGLSQADERKRAFVMVVLPLVLQANEQILGARARLLALEARVRAGETPAPADQAWLEALAARYETEPGDWEELRRRVDVVPTSLAVAQAAMESGWGTSRFAIEANALFGQWTLEAQYALIPAERDPGETYGIRRFDALGESVAAYALNLNTHRAYRNFRARRADMRRAGQGPDGADLAEFLGAYSEQGTAYVRALRQIIERNGLAPLDEARLTPSASRTQLSERVPEGPPAPELEQIRRKPLQ